MCIPDFMEIHVPDSDSIPNSRPGHFIAGAGAPVVMLHASLGSKSQWTKLAERLAPRYRVIAIDLCGYGDNEAPATAPFTLDEEVRHVMDRLDPLVGTHTRFHVVGHSYGGLVALRLAQRRSERVASLSLYEPVVFRVLDRDDRDLAVVGQLAQLISCLVAAGRRRDAAQMFVDFWSGDGSFASLPLPAQVSIARRVDKLPFDFQAAMSWPWDLEDLRAIVAPVLLLVGNRGPAIVRRIHRLLARTLPNHRVGAFDAGHMGPITHADQVNPWIEAFVDICAHSHVPSTVPRRVVPPATPVFARSLAGSPSQT